MQLSTLSAPGLVDFVPVSIFVVVVVVVVVVILVVLPYSRDIKIKIMLDIN